MDQHVDTHKDGRSVVLQPFEFPPTLIGRLRRWVHRLAGEWAIRYLIQQQNEINGQLNQTEYRLKGTLHQLDHDHVETRRQLAELTTLVIQQQKRIEELEAQGDDRPTTGG